jgi:hypothetical protein
MRLLLVPLLCTAFAKHEDVEKVIVADLSSDKEFNSAEGVKVSQSVLVSLR